MMPLKSIYSKKMFNEPKTLFKYSRKVSEINNPSNWRESDINRSLDGKTYPS
jgi:hypothetical protein